MIEIPKKCEDCPVLASCITHDTKYEWLLEKQLAFAEENDARALEALTHLHDSKAAFNELQGSMGVQASEFAQELSDNNWDLLMTAREYFDSMGVTAKELEEVMQIYPGMLDRPIGELLLRSQQASKDGMAIVMNGAEELWEQITEQISKFQILAERARDRINEVQSLQVDNEETATELIENCDGQNEVIARRFFARKTTIECGSRAIKSILQ